MGTHEPKLRIPTVACSWYWSPRCRPCDEDSRAPHFFRRIPEDTDRDVGEMGQEGEEVKEERDW